MYKVEIPADRFETAAIQRRQKLDEERKKRIFDPKLRVLGVDLLGLQQQIEEKHAINVELQARDQVFANTAKLTNQILEAMDDQVIQSRRQSIREIAEFRKQCQRPPQRRDYDLYDPDALKKEHPPRTESFDGCGVSALQRFEGEDLAHDQRTALQKHQMKIWVKEQAAAKHEKFLQEQDEARHYANFEHAMLSKLNTVNAAVENARRERLKLDKEFNLHLAQEKKQQVAQQKQNETEANLKEIFTQINGPFLTEQPDAFNVRGEKVKVRVDVFKGMTEEQRNQIQATQEQQRREKEMTDLRNRQNEQIWNAKSDATNRALTLLEREKRRQSKEYALKIQNENEEKKKEDKHRQEYLDKVIYTNPPSDAYFAQFNTTSR